VAGEALFDVLFFAPDLVYYAGHVAGHATGHAIAASAESLSHAHFGPRLPPISLQAYHSFRSKLTTHFGAS
jgi:hypothetical protein